MFRAEIQPFARYLRTAALGGDVHLDRIAGHDFVMNHAGGIVVGVFARAVGIVEDRCAQDVIGMQVGAANALVANVGQRHVGLPLHVHADAQEYGDDAGILANRAMAHRAHARIDQDLRDGVARGRVLLAPVSLVHAADKVQRVVIGNVLQRVGNAVDQIVLLDGGHVERAGRDYGYFNHRASSRKVR